MVYIYAIYPFNDKGNAVGVYIGRTHCVEQRIKQHLYDHTDPISDDMKKGFAYQILDETEEENGYLEYDYIDFFMQTKLPVLNTRIGNHADYRKVILRLLGKHIDFFTL